jgi:hypothetical protein
MASFAIWLFEMSTEWFAKVLILTARHVMLSTTPVKTPTTITSPTSKGLSAWSERPAKRLPSVSCKARPTMMPSRAEPETSAPSEMSGKTYFRTSAPDST